MKMERAAGGEKEPAQKAPRRNSQGAYRTGAVKTNVGVYSVSP